MPHDSPHTDWDLIRDAAQGAKEGLERFAEHYLPAVRAYLAARFHHNGMGDDLDDAVQEVFLTCLRRSQILSNADPDRGFRQLLFGVARNVARNLERGQFRRRKNVPTQDLDPQLLPDQEQQLSRIFDRSYARQVMRQARALMAEEADSRGDAARRRVELLRLRFEEGLPIREIAQRWEMDQRWLHREYAKAAKEFKGSLSRAVGMAGSRSPADVARECEHLLRMLG